ncbi:hypothetical protein PVAR5_0995 [Paecilomyces variotii No. 5]|uniref:Uncharacterized protein n=1 Tax=Byssochlamys spectabilis (strain No. 5 / NBRC 109023) TaxID=1356009 RepID=V5F8W5_BYSSN|nr:hypothetical protein PVAR5_0995 [Paecilomyces variotii No. 5]
MVIIPQGHTASVLGMVLCLSSGPVQLQPPRQSCLAKEDGLMVALSLVEGTSAKPGVIWVGCAGFAVFSDNPLHLYDHPPFYWLKSAVSKPAGEQEQRRRRSASRHRDAPRIFLDCPCTISILTLVSRLEPLSYTCLIGLPLGLHTRPPAGGKWSQSEPVARPAGIVGADDPILAVSFHSRALIAQPYSIVGRDACSLSLPEALGILNATLHCSSSSSSSTLLDILSMSLASQSGRNSSSHPALLLEALADPIASRCQSSPVMRCDAMRCDAQTWHCDAVSSNGNREHRPSCSCAIFCPGLVASWELNATTTGETPRKRPLQICTSEAISLKDLPLTNPPSRLRCSSHRASISTGTDALCIHRTSIEAPNRLSLPLFLWNTFPVRSRVVGLWASETSVSIGSCPDLALIHGRACLVATGRRRTAADAGDDLFASLLRPRTEPDGDLDRQLRDVIYGSYGTL